MFGSSGLVGLTITTASASNNTHQVQNTTSNYLWKSSSYQIQNSERNLVVDANSDDIIITLPQVSEASDVQSHFIGNLYSSTLSITVRSYNNDSFVESDNQYSTSLENGTGCEFVLNKSLGIWIGFSR